MREPGILLPREETPTPGGLALPASMRRLPPDLLEEASRRLGWASLIYSTTFFLAFFGSHVLSAMTGVMGWSLLEEAPLQTLVAAISILFGLVVFYVSRRGRIGPALLLDLGLAFEVVGAFGIAMAEFWAIFPVWDEEAMQYVHLGLSWVCVWILIFPLVAPNTPGKVLLAALASASAPPITILLSRAAGASSPDAPLLPLLVYFPFTTYLCAGLAYFVSRIVYRYGLRLMKAREVGSYRLVERLGTGGMGEVWRAEHRLLARPAAVKLVRGDVLGSDPATRRMALRRFEREARATAALGSTHTIQLYDFGTTEEGAFYYVMELLDGLSLDALVERFGPQPAGRVVHLLLQVCHSLGEAHARGMIHRDVKPANIYACRLGPDRDFVKVLDFGLVKGVAEEGPDATELTAAGMAAGTPAFMAPEMATGREAVDGRADLYGLGCVAYWLLTGQRVFEGDSPLAVLLDHVRTPPDPPSSRTEIGVPGQLEAIVLSCLEKDPADRPRSAENLADRLRRTGLAEEWGEEEARQWWGLHAPDPA